MAAILTPPHTTVTMGPKVRRRLQSRNESFLSFTSSNMRGAKLVWGLQRFPAADSQQLDELSSECKSRSNNGEFQLQLHAFVSRSLSSVARWRTEERCCTDSSKFLLESCIKHHYIFITRRQRVKEIDEAGSTTAARLLSLSVCHL